MRVVGMLRIKNESRWIRRVLDSIAPLCAKVYVLDDHSTDGTGDICREWGAEVIDNPSAVLNEAVDKDLLLATIAEQEQAGTWVLCIDGDELLEPNGADKIVADLARGGAEAYTLRIVYLWDREDQKRVDGCYGRFYRPSLFRLRPGLSFRRTGAHANFHCSSVPAQYIGSCATSSAALLHLGYLHREDRIRKYDWYRGLDSNNSVEDGYRHTVIGDVFPAESVFRHAGPLKLEALNAR